MKHEYVYAPVVQDNSKRKTSSKRKSSTTRVTVVDDENAPWPKIEMHAWFILVGGCFCVFHGKSRENHELIEQFWISQTHNWYWFKLFKHMWIPQRKFFVLHITLQSRHLRFWKQNKSYIMMMKPNISTSGDITSMKWSSESANIDIKQTIPTLKALTGWKSWNCSNP